MKRMLLVCLVVFGSVLNWNIVFAADVYVESTGSCGGNTPCYSTIQAAINAANSGDTIKLAQGIYAETAILNSGKQLRLQGGWDVGFTAKTRGATSIGDIVVTSGAISVKELIMTPAVNHNCDFSSGDEEPERCYGGVGVRCEGIPSLAPFRKCEHDCWVLGWVSVGSILHDRCCLRYDNLGYSCVVQNIAWPGYENICKEEWEEAWRNTGCLFGERRQWQHWFGPYPAGNSGDDTSQELRAPPGSPVNPIYETICSSGKCQVDALGNTIIYDDDGCRQFCRCSDGDDDGDGFTVNDGDCDDDDDSIHPGASEQCGDRIDQDCDGSDPICNNDGAIIGTWHLSTVNGTTIAPGIFLTWSFTESTCTMTCDLDCVEIYTYSASAGVLRGTSVISQVGSQCGGPYDVADGVPAQYIIEGNTLSVVIVDPELDPPTATFVFTKAH